MEYTKERAMEWLNKHALPDTFLTANSRMAQEVQTDVPPPPAASTCIWERFEEASRTIPDEELDRLPTDLAAQVDHYIYGTPKR